MSNEGDEGGYIVLNSGWEEGGIYKFTARAQAFRGNGEINFWMMKLEFETPVDEIEVSCLNIYVVFSF